MSKTFLSFLGTNEYLECNYVLGERRAERVKFVQEALLQLCCSDFTSQDRVIFLLTKDARERNWETPDGLADRIERLDLQAEVVTVEIPPGSNSEELWQVFGNVYEALGQNDELVLDVTHGFRSLPMLGLTLLYYARFLKNTTVLGIYYGAFEALGTRRDAEALPIEKRDAPVFDVTAFSELQAWTTAAENFTNHGNAHAAAELLEAYVEPRLRRSGLTENDSPAYLTKRLCKTLRTISGDLAAVRGRKLIDGKQFEHLRDQIRALRAIQELPRPLKPLFERFEDIAARFRPDDPMNLLHAAELASEFGHVNQGITLMHEFGITAVGIILGLDFDDFDTRRRIEAALGYLAGKSPSERKQHGSTAELVELKNAIFRTPEAVGIVEPWDKLRHHRNDINHGGLGRNVDHERDQPRPAEQFEKQLCKVIQDMKQTDFVRARLR